jgi:hypothetical protein
MNCTNASISEKMRGNHSFKLSAISQPHVNAMKKTNLQQAVLTVVDHRHPHYGKTFPLLKVIFSKGKRIGVVDIGNGVARYIPIEATDRGSTPAFAHNAPVDLESLTKLCNLYHLLLEHTQ